MKSFKSPSMFRRLPKDDRVPIREVAPPADPLQEHSDSPQTGSSEGESGSTDGMSARSSAVTPAAEGFLVVREEGIGNFVEYRFASAEAARKKAKASSYSWVLWDCGDRPAEEWKELSHGGMGVLIGAAKTIRAHVKKAYAMPPLTHSKAAPGQLVLTIKSASGLQAVDSDHRSGNAESDPYAVVVSRPGALPLSGQTDYRRNSCDPVWNKTFVFDKVESLDTRVKIEIRDLEKMATDRTMAMVEFPLKELQEEMSFVQTGDFAGEPVEISRKLRPSDKSPKWLKELPAGSLGHDAPLGRIELLVGWRKDCAHCETILAGLEPTAARHGSQPTLSRVKPTRRLSTRPLILCGPDQFVVVSEEGVGNFLEEKFEHADPARTKYASGSFKSSWVLFDCGTADAPLKEWRKITSGGMGIYTGAESRITRHVIGSYSASSELQALDEEADELPKAVEGMGESEVDEAAMKREQDLALMQAGSYQLQVHIIEAKGLDGRDAGGLADPLVVIKAFGQRHSTSVKKQRLAAYWDEYFIIQAERSKTQLSQSQIELRVEDQDLFSTEPIGSFEIDALTVYYQPHHTIRKQWVALSAPPYSERKRAFNAPHKGGCTGYLLLSIAMLGPGDVPMAEEEDDEQPAEKILLPPSLKEQIVFARVAVLCARQLPSAQSWYVEVSCENRKAKTKVVAHKSVDPNFMEELWMPLHVPSLGIRLQIALKDKSKPSEPLYTLTLGVKELLQDCSKGEQLLRWYHIYGLDDSAHKDSFFSSGIKASKLSQFEDEFKSAWRGQLLLGFRAEHADKDNLYTKDKLSLSDRIFHLPLRGQERFEETWKPPEEMWELKAAVLAGAGNAKRMEAMHVEVVVGEHVFESQRPVVRSGQASFLRPPGEDARDQLNPLRWIDVGFTKPLASVELKNEALAAALALTDNFSEEDWRSFGVRELRSHHVVKAGGVFFQPAGIATAPGVLRPRNRRPEFPQARTHMPDVIIYLCDGPKRLFFKRLEPPSKKVDLDTQPYLDIQSEWFMLLPTEPKGKIRESSGDEALPSLFLSIRLQLAARGLSSQPPSSTAAPTPESPPALARARESASARRKQASQQPLLSPEERIERLEQRLTCRLPRRRTLCAYELRLHVFMGRDLVSLRLRLHLPPPPIALSRPCR